MQKFFVTFGQNQTYPHNSYVEVHAESYNAARDKIFANCGTSWSFIYTEKEFAPQPEKYSLYKADQI